MAEFRAIETQEQLNGIIQERLNRQKDSYEGQLDDLRSQVERLKGLEAVANQKDAEISRLSGALENSGAKVAEQDARIRALEAEQLRAQVAASVGVPLQLSERLKGNTREELENDAKELMAFMNPVGSSVQQLRATEPPIHQHTEAEKAYKKLVDGLFRQ